MLVLLVPPPRPLRGGGAGSCHGSTCVRGEAREVSCGRNVCSPRCCDAANGVWAWTFGGRPLQQFNINRASFTCYSTSCPAMASACSSWASRSSPRTSPMDPWPQWGAFGDDLWPRCLRKTTPLEARRDGHYDSHDWLQCQDLWDVGGAYTCFIRALLCFRVPRHGRPRRRQCATALSTPPHTRLDVPA